MRIIIKFIITFIAFCLFFSNINFGQTDNEELTKKRIELLNVYIKSKSHMKPAFKTDMRAVSSRLDLNTREELYEMYQKKIAVGITVLDILFPLSSTFGIGSAIQGDDFGFVFQYAVSWGGFVAVSVSGLQGWAKFNSLPIGQQTYSALISNLLVPGIVGFTCFSIAYVFSWIRPILYENEYNSNLRESLGLDTSVKISLLDGLGKIKPDKRYADVFYYNLISIEY